MNDCVRHALFTVPNVPNRNVKKKMLGLKFSQNPVFAIRYKN